MCGTSDVVATTTNWTFALDEFIIYMVTFGIPLYDNACPSLNDDVFSSWTEEGRLHAVDGNSMHGDRGTGTNPGNDMIV